MRKPIIQTILDFSLFRRMEGFERQRKTSSYICLIFMNKITSLLVYSQDHNKTAKWIYTKFG